MIKLFRGIRQNLLNEGKTTKYLKYAIGEIKSTMDWLYPDHEVVSNNAVRLRQSYEVRLKDATFCNGLSLAAGNNLYLVDEYNKMISIINKLN
tara:strand:+ start:3500 stop:3778 length:279 start_codon:yes stop_codon:yes gene_type:complete